NPSNNHDLHTQLLASLHDSGRGNSAYYSAARTFFAQWPNVHQWSAQSLQLRLAATAATRPIITFLMLHHQLRPGYDYLLERKLSSIWREIKASPIAVELDQFMVAASQLGFTERVRFATGSQVPARLLIQTDKPLRHLTLDDLAAFKTACADRQHRTGKGHRHYLSRGSNTQRLSFHPALATASVTSAQVPVTPHGRGSTSALWMNCPQPAARCLSPYDWPQASRRSATRWSPICNANKPPVSPRRSHQSRPG